MPETVTVVWSPLYEVDIGPHVFPTAKYRLVRQRLLERGTVPASDFVQPAAASEEALARVHTAEYLRKIDRGDFTDDELRRLEVPFSPELAAASRLCCGGTIATAESALSEGVAVHLGGGFHHAFPDHGEGFCLLNDVAVAAADVLRVGRVERVLVVDLDVHHGNGTAAIFARDPRVFTFSMHQQNNYPAEKPRSDLDVGLPDRTGDRVYLDLLAHHLPKILEEHRPQLVLYLAGADPYREDQLGGLSLTREGLRLRDRIVLDASRAAGAGVAITLAGGYARRTADTVEIHASTVEEAAAARRSAASGGGDAPAPPDAPVLRP
jgi:acetoin utilization deacetylase AcuC-like enzyme